MRVQPQYAVTHGSITRNECSIPINHWQKKQLKALQPFKPDLPKVQRRLCIKVIVLKVIVLKVIVLKVIVLKVIVLKVVVLNMIWAKMMWANMIMLKLRNGFAARCEAWLCPAATTHPPLSGCALS
jgi:hypothetical protein